MSLTDILEQFAYIANNPNAILKKYIEEGKDVIGCFPIYTPKPIIDAAGAVPMGLWGGRITPTFAGKYSPVFTCSIMRSCLELGMTGRYDGLKAVIMPILCDTFRGMSSSWRAGVTDIPLIALVHPQNRTDLGAQDFLAQEYLSVKLRLEKILNREITDESLHESIKKYNYQNALVMKFSKLALNHLDVIKPLVRHYILKSAQFISVDEHIRLMENLIEELEKLPEHVWSGKRAYFIGITAEPDELLQLFDKYNIAIVGDNLAQESRQFRTDYEICETPFWSLSSQWMHIEGCSTVHDENADMLEKFIIKEAKECAADSVVDCLMRFCDVEEYDYPDIAKCCEEEGLYCLCLEIDQSSEDNGQTLTKIQSYSEL